jgi:predicted flap endonuclease-1-like 5' DNA nuclease
MSSAPSSAQSNTTHAIDAMSAVTATHVVLMVAVGIAALATLWWGTVLHRRRKAAQDQVDADFKVAEEHGATSQPTAVSSDGAVAVSADVPTSISTPDETHTAAIATDLTQIKGLGPKLAATLAEQGITRVDQIAALTPEAAAELDAKLGTFQGRMARDRWIEQAKLLSAGDRAGYEAAFGKLGG